MSDQELILPPDTNIRFKVIEYSVNVLLYALLGSILLVVIWFVLQDSLTPFRQHILFCVLGYQLLMAQAILTLSPGNSWSLQMSLLHRKRAHWIIQLLGSISAIYGSSMEISNKTAHFTSIHGTLGILALIFTCVSLVNGLSSLYATELRTYIPPSVSKISHILIGTLAFTLASVCLCYGFRKGSFTRWASEGVGYTMIVITSIYTLFINLVPCLKLYKKIYNMFS